MDKVTAAILLGILACVLLLYYLNAREKSAIRRKGRRRFRPSWRGREGETRRRKRP